MSAVQVKNQEKIQIKLRGYDYRLMDESIRKIVDTCKRAGARVCGPVPLPTRVEKFTYLKSPHVNKDARDQIEIRTHARVVYIMQPDAATIDALMKLNLASGIDIQISIEHGDN